MSAATEFQIIIAGWNCLDVIEQTLMSVERQRYPHWHCHLVDDGSSPDQQKFIYDWVTDHDRKWSCTLHDENGGGIRRQYEGVREMNPSDEDIIVFLDMDGDQLAHDRVLDRLVHYYNDPNVLVTYGSYRPQPDPGGPVPISRYPADVEARNSYREDTANNGPRYNHLRTSKWKILKAIPDSYYHFDDGEWIFSPADLIPMVACLELAGGRYKYIEETLLLYNANQPYPDNIRNQARNVRGSQYTFGLRPLERL